MKDSSTDEVLRRAGSWSAGQVAVAAFVMLAFGVLAGYLFHNSAAAGDLASSGAHPSTVPARASVSGGAVQALLDQLRSHPDNPDLLAGVGNAYYDQREYGQAVTYYQRYLRLRPQDVPVRTDMGTAMWYSGNPDGAIQEYETALRYKPDYPNTLFNMGIVKWQGKQDRWGALDAWQKLLSTHPGYPDRPRVEQLMEKVRAEIARAQPGSR